MSEPKNKILYALDEVLNPEQYGDKDIPADAPRIVLGLGTKTNPGLKLSELDQYLLTHTTIGEEMSPFSDMRTEEPLTAERRNTLGHRLLSKLFLDCFPDRDHPNGPALVMRRN